MTRSTWSVNAVLMALSVLSACDDPVTSALAPQFADSPYENCSEDDGIRICLPEQSFAPGSSVPFTVANAFDRIVFLDGCRGGVEGFRPESQDWGGPGSGRACLQLQPDDPTEEESTLAEMRYLPRGRLVYDTMWVNSRAFDGDWRLWIRVLDADASQLREDHFFSPVFEVRR